MYDDINWAYVKKKNCVILHMEIFAYSREKVVGLATLNCFEFDGRNKYLWPRANLLYSFLRQARLGSHLLSKWIIQPQKF